MNSIALVHPRLLAATPPALWPSLCTIKEVIDTQDQSGQPLQTIGFISGLVDLPCRKSPIGQGNRYSIEKRLGAMTLGESDSLIYLKGYYPNIVTKNIAEVDGVAHDLQGVFHDGNHTLTVLAVKIISV